MLGQYFLKGVPDSCKVVIKVSPQTDLRTGDVLRRDGLCKIAKVAQNACRKSWQKRSHQHKHRPLNHRCKRAVPRCLYITSDV